MAYGKVKNAAGQVRPGEPGRRHRSAAARPRACRTISASPSPTLRGKDAYPISSFTWLLIPEKIADAAKKKAIKDFLTWMLADGQKMTEALAYAPLPKAVVAKEMKAIAKIQ